MGLAARHPTDLLIIFKTEAFMRHIKTLDIAEGVSLVDDYLDPMREDEPMPRQVVPFQMAMTSILARAAERRMIKSPICII